MKKQIIDKIEYCYSVNAIKIGGEPWLLFGGERGGALCAYHGRDFQEKVTILSPAERLGGVMSISTIPDREGYFFMSAGFYSMVQSETSSIYLVRYRNGQFQREKICDIPYLHRFDVLTVEGRRFLIACTLHQGKHDDNDWSTPGKILGAELPLDLDKRIDIQLTVLADGLYQNHGFNRIPGTNDVLTSSREGVFRITPPKKGGVSWKIKQIFDFPASDVCALDLDGDGRLEYGIISPFHGNCFRIYRQTPTEMKILYEHPKPLDFYHAIYADTLNGIPVFIAGARKMDMDLYQVFWNAEEGKFCSEIIEAGAGSSNARIVHTAAGDILMSANRQKQEAEGVIFTN